MAACPYFGTTLYMFQTVSIPGTVCTVLDSWWRTERPPESCRVLFQNKINLRYCASSWCNYRNTHTHTHTHTHISGRTPLDEWSSCRRGYYLHKKHKHMKTSMSSEGFKPKTPAIKGLQIYTLDHTANRASPAFYAEMNPSIHWIGDWVGPRAGLDILGKRRISWSWRNSKPRSSNP